MTCASDWIGFNCGDTVHAADDPRHLGRVEVLYFEGGIKIRWRETGWISVLARDELVVVDKAAPARGYIRQLTSRPSTVVESPRRQLERILAGG
jgi:hypothetical protein